MTTGWVFPTMTAVRVLPTELVEARKKHVATIPLADVGDVVYAFFHCRDCGARWTTVTQLVGNPHGVMNSLPAVARLLLDTPERLVPGAKDSRCECGSSVPATLEVSVLCLTNPRRGNGFHLRVRHGEDVDDDTFTAAVLFPDGRYVAVPHESFVRALVPGS
jgi:hypothetical protein